MGEGGGESGDGVDDEGEKEEEEDGCRFGE